jgi:hypothetical protein
MLSFIDAAIVLFMYVVINGNINMDSTKAGSMNDNINMNSTIAASINDNIT